MARTNIASSWPDLPGARAAYFAIGLEMDEGVLANLLGSLELPRDPGAEKFVQHYTKSGTKHEAYGHFHKRAETGDLVCHISYDLDPRSYPTGTRRFSELFSALVDQEIPVLGHCSATFEWELETVRPILALPWRFLEYEGAPFDEIRGFRAVKLAADKEIQFSAIVDMRGQEGLSAVVDFDYAAAFDRHFVENAFRRADDFMKRLVHHRTED